MEIYRIGRRHLEDPTLSIAGLVTSRLASILELMPYCRIVLSSLGELCSQYALRAKALSILMTLQKALCGMYSVHAAMITMALQK